MDIRSNEPYWLIRNAFNEGYPSLDQSVTTDILIIGGGITGALMAWKLISEGRQVLLIDRRDVCNGSSAASTAMLQYEIDLPLFELTEQRGYDVALSSFKNCERAISTLKDIVEAIDSDCQFEFKKSVWFSSHRKHDSILQKEFDARVKAGFSVKWLDKKALEELGVKGRAAIVSESGAVMDPYKFTWDLLKHCVERGLTVFDRTEIRKTKQKGGKMIATTTGKHTIEANHIIHCTGYESVNMLGKKIVSLKSTYALASEAFGELPSTFRNHIFWETSSPYFYFRSTPDNRIIAGGGDERFRNATVRDAMLEKKHDFLDKKFKKFFPEIAFKPDYIWAGTFGETKDGLPYIGRPNPELNEHYVLGFGGNGITYSVMAMDAILNSMNHTGHRYLDDYRFGR